MKLAQMFKLGVPKKWLIFVAACLWGMAGYRVLLIGYGDLHKDASPLVIDYVIAAIIFGLFFRYVFFKMYKKHTKRIVNIPISKPSIFSFFDVKGYLIMGFMITFGISLRASGIFPPVVIGTFYLGLGFALFLAGVMFAYAFINYSTVHTKYTVSSDTHA